jgi:hypothetical protein
MISSYSTKGMIVSFFNHETDYSYSITTGQKANSYSENLLKIHLPQDANQRGRFLTDNIRQILLGDT